MNITNTHLKKTKTDTIDGLETYHFTQRNAEAFVYDSEEAPKTFHTRSIGSSRINLFDVICYINGRQKRRADEKLARVGMNTAQQRKPQNVSLLLSHWRLY